MLRLGGLLVMLAGASLGAFVLILPSISEERNLREETRISAAPGRVATPVVQASPAQPAKTVSEASAEEASEMAAAKVAEMTASMPARPSSTWSAIVSSEPASQNRLTSPKPGDGEARIQLTRDLQKELQRVGCYGGDITGNWTPATKRGMSAFMDRVNATLPVDEPDYILLTLVQGHAAAACGTDCPAGQVAENGRCVPQAVVAQATRKQLREEQKRLADEQKAAEQTRLAEARKAEEDARAAEAKRVAEEKRVAAEKRLAEEKKLAEQRAVELKEKARAAIAAAETEHREELTQQAIAAAVPEELPWLNNKPAAVPAVKRPEGMMSIGGPRVAKAEVPDDATAVTPEAGPAPVVVLPEQGKDQGKDDAVQPEQAVTPPPAIVPAPKKYRAPQFGQPGTKSGPAVRRRQAVETFVAPPKRIKKTRTVRRSSPPPPVVRIAKPKFSGYASNNGWKSKSKMYRPHYNMMQAYSGMY